MAAIMLNAAAMAYRKASAKTRDATKSNPDIPPWLAHVAEKLREDDSDLAPSDIKESTHHKKERLFMDSTRPYERLAWKVYINITSTKWFEAFILFNIMLVGITTGLDLENNGRDEWTVAFSDNIGYITLGVFTLECTLKIIAEGFEPWIYFTDPDDGNFNTFDFMIVVASYAFLGSAGSAIGGLRMLRLVRLLTFVKTVEELRIIVAGLVQGIKSVVYIVILLFLIIYIFAILGCILFGENDPAHFGDVSIAILTLFQVSTQASWTSIAYVSWFGCEDYLGSPYGDGHPSRISTLAGHFEGFKCTTNIPNPLLTGVFFAFYILLTSWVIMSLFIGVISMGMFESYINMKEEMDLQSYIKHLADNTQNETRALQHSLKVNKKTLKEQIDLCLEDDDETYNEEIEKAKTFYHKFVIKMRVIRDSTEFTLLITLLIIIVGFAIGVDTDHTVACHRIEWRDMKREDDDGLEHKVKNCETQPLPLFIIAMIAQAIFTLEAFVKIVAQGRHPERYFTDDENGSWNCLDFFIVIVGFMELTPASFIFENFPVVLLRLLRLLRVFRLAEALPRLRSIVEALVSGFSSVGWICILIFVFNYIVACMFMLIFRANDPFHFGSVGKALFTVLRMETLDTWDQILYMVMYGCDYYPAGYPFLNPNNNNHKGYTCDSNKAFGWYGVIILFFMLILGAYVMPTILIGIVSIKFNNATKLLNTLTKEKELYQKRLIEAKKLLPDFFTEKRIEAIQEAFSTLDSGGELTLDMQEIAPFFHYSIASLFDCELTPKMFESLFYLVDTTLTSDVGLGEFVTMISILKQMQNKAKSDPEFRHQLFGALNRKQIPPIAGEITDNNKPKSKWDLAMERVDKESLDVAWDTILRSINGVPGDSIAEKVNSLFKDFDSDGTGELDLHELGAGLKSCGIRLNERQLDVLAKSVDIDGDGNISFGEFAIQVEKVIHDREMLKEREKNHSTNVAVRRKSTSLGRGNGSGGGIHATPSGSGPLLMAPDPVRTALLNSVDDLRLRIDGLKAEISYLQHGNTTSFDYNFGTTTTNQNKNKNFGTRLDNQQSSSSSTVAPVSPSFSFGTFTNGSNTREGRINSVEYTTPQNSEGFGDTFSAPKVSVPKFDDILGSLSNFSLGTAV